MPQTSFSSSAPRPTTGASAGTRCPARQGRRLGGCPHYSGDLRQPKPDGEVCASFLSAAVENWIPEPLRPVSHRALTSETAYRQLYDFLLGQAGVEPQPVGSLKPQPRRRGTPLAFTETHPSAAVNFDLSRILKYAPPSSSAAKKNSSSSTTPGPKPASPRLRVPAS